MPDTYTLVLLRHGESEWNAKNLFTGWVDVPLNEKGENEARRGAELMRDAGLAPDVVHTSLLRRAIATAQITLDGIDRHWVPVHRTWRLNERHYGALQGKDKKATLEEFGEEQFMKWRRSYDTPPPPIDPADPYSQDADPRYADLPPEARPRTECLEDVLARMLPYWYDGIVPDLRCRIGTTASCPTCAATTPSSSPHTATRFGRWSSTSTTSMRKRSSGSTSRPASHCCTSSTSRCARSRRVASTSTPTPRPTRSRRWRHRAARRQRALPRVSRCDAYAGQHSGTPGSFDAGWSM